MIKCFLLLQMNDKFWFLYKFLWICIFRDRSRKNREKNVCKKIKCSIKWRKAVFTFLFNTLFVTKSDRSILEIYYYLIYLITI